MYTCQLFVNGIGLLPIRRTKFLRKMLYDEQVVFNCKYSNLSYNAYIAINVWSTAKSYNER